MNQYRMCVSQTDTFRVSIQSISDCTPIHAKEPYKKDCTVQKRRIILRSLLIVATPYTYIPYINTECVYHRPYIHVYSYINTAHSILIYGKYVSQCACSIYQYSRMCVSPTATFRVSIQSISDCAPIHAKLMAYRTNGMQNSCTSVRTCRVRR